ncbi:hypothetical protein PN36_22810 [Candidatus Thiomargarita nelsonii]|uniref:Uncharacterized protein n=1 Tax=Candidatus Thiomargarita nelsonii TaxID=1003181 RepID=A0A0A6P4L5_9GAMM|nr:hypothetical protein PN36_22810 [Candidatus Thiomargarita nelsonii]
MKTHKKQSRRSRAEKWADLGLIVCDDKKSAVYYLKGLRKEFSHKDDPHFLKYTEAKVLIKKTQLADGVIFKAITTKLTGCNGAKLQSGGA